MKKTTLLFTLVLFTIFSCNNSTERNSFSEEFKLTDTERITIIDTTHFDEKNKQEVQEDVNTFALQQSDEEILFSFKTEKGKTMNILLQKDEKYMVYRYGTENKLELQFPEELKNTFEQFSYNFYFRGGGAANLGLDLNYLSFSGDTHKFIIFQEYSAEGEEGEGESELVGIRILNLKTKKETVIKGINSTVKGHLMEFRDNGLVKIVDEI